MEHLVSRYFATEPDEHLKRPLCVLQPILAREGKASIDLGELAKSTAGCATVKDVIAVESAEHWDRCVRGIGPETDAIVLVSVPANPSEVWNAHPEPLVQRRLPVLFWSLTGYDEPDLWRWSARDMLRALGVEVKLVRNARQGMSILRGLAMRRLLADSKIVVFGEQNFPWNAHAVGRYITQRLGTRIIVKTLSDFRGRYDAISDAEVREYWDVRKARYKEATVRAPDLKQGIRTALAIRSILKEEKAFGFGVNCYGELLVKGGRDVPCLAQTLLREEGYLATCDGDFCALLSMSFISHYLDLPCFMSNLYPISYVGAITEHFAEPLSPSRKKYPPARWKNMARLGHCAFTGVVSPEMTPNNQVRLKDYGGTLEINRDGRGCGIDGDVRKGPVTMVQLDFSARKLLVAKGRMLETTRHRRYPHCEATALVEFENLGSFLDNISREHPVVAYGDHVDDLGTLSEILGLECVRIAK